MVRTMGGKSRARSQWRVQPDIIRATYNDQCHDCSSRVSILSSIISGRNSTHRPCQQTCKPVGLQSSLPLRSPLTRSGPYIPPMPCLRSEFMHSLPPPGLHVPANIFVSGEHCRHGDCGTQRATDIGGILLRKRLLVGDDLSER